MEKSITAVMTLFIHLPFILGANPHWKFLKDTTALRTVFCQDKGSACKMSSGNYGCCPAKDGVCCVNTDHCCPSGFKCDLSANRCVKYEDTAVYQLTEDVLNVTPIEAGEMAACQVTKGISLQSPVGDICEDSTNKCPNKETCCKVHVSADGYGCCPWPNATCCTDMKHCCPQDYKCDDPTRTCTKATPQLEIKSHTTVYCPADNVTCPGGTDCCVVYVSGRYGCCPLNGTCSDGEKHYCPKGYECDAFLGTCVTKVKCPDRSTCGNNDTCCHLTSSTYGCCPSPNATCCSDGKHCCPVGYICDMISGTCTMGAVVKSIGLIEHLDPSRDGVKNVVCPDNEVSCPNSSTCCSDNDVSYGCCPLPDANCCDDHMHCCPNGYICDTAVGACLSLSGL